MVGKSKQYVYDVLDDWTHIYIYIYLAKWFIIFHQPHDFPEIFGVPFPYFSPPPFGGSHRSCEVASL